MSRKLVRATPRVTVVVATMNRREELSIALDHLTSLPERPAILVMDNGSTDGTAEAVRMRNDGTSVVELGENLGCAARNIGVAMATTPVVAFSDDDSWWAPGALHRACDLFEQHPRMALLAGKILVGAENKPDPVCAEMAAATIGVDNDLPGPSVLGFLACGAVVRRSMYLAAGGFPGHYGIGGEEAPLAIDLAARGWGLAYVEDVVAHHHPSPSRNPARRRAVQLRNDLWFSWTREPASAVVRRTWSAVRHAASDEAARQGVLEAAGRIPTIFRERRVPPDAVAANLATLRSPGAAGC